MTDIKFTKAWRAEHGEYAIVFYPTRRGRRPGYQIQLYRAGALVACDTADSFYDAGRKAVSTMKRLQSLTDPPGVTAGERIKAGEAVRVDERGQAWRVGK